MTETTTAEAKLDRTSWGPGEWDEEPDHVVWTTTAGLPAIAHRNHLGAWCGYVAVPPGHPAHGQGLDSEAIDSLEAPGGLTYANACQGAICHVPPPGEPDGVWWLGFDCGHAWDYVPGLHARFSLPAWPEATYRTLAYVRAACEQLGMQIRSLEEARPTA